MATDESTTLKATSASEGPQIELLEKLRSARAGFSRCVLRPNTIIGYTYAWKSFLGFCASVQATPLPAEPDIVGLYATDMLVKGTRVATIKHRLAAVVHRHREAGHPHPISNDTRELLKGARRQRSEPPTQVRPLTIAQVRAISKMLAEEGMPLAMRNRAIVVMGFGSALRSANLVALEFEDIEFSDRGLVLSIRRSKTDPDGKGAFVGIPTGKHPETCAVRCLRQWLDIRGRCSGALFCRLDGERGRPILPERVGLIVQSLVRRIGVSDWKAYSSHSLRSGAITALAEAGASDLMIARQSLHKDMAVLRQYVRPQDVFRANPIELLDL